MYNHKLILVRGVPGSGKTTFAKELMKNCDYNDHKHFEADMYHLNMDGDYNWKSENVTAAHDWCFNSARIGLAMGYSVIVSNTFVKIWEMDNYINLANDSGIEFVVFRMISRFDNIHNVPTVTVERMLKSFQDYDGEILVN